MESFTNQTLDTKQLPRYEEVQLSALHPKYKRVTLINVALIIAILIIAFAVFYFVKFL